MLMCDIRHCCYTPTTCKFTLLYLLPVWLSHLFSKPLYFRQSIFIMDFDVLLYYTFACVFCVTCLPFTFLFIRALKYTYNLLRRITSYTFDIPTHGIEVSNYSISVICILVALLLLTTLLMFFQLVPHLPLHVWCILCIFGTCHNLLHFSRKYATCESPFYKPKCWHFSKFVIISQM